MDSSIVDNVFSVLSFFLFPFVDFFAAASQCIIVVQMSGDSTCLPIFWLVFLLPSSVCRDDESWVPLGSFSGPSFLALCGDSESLAPFQFILSLDPNCDVACWHFLISFFRVSFSCIYSNLQIRLLGLLCCPHHHRMIFCCLGRIHRLYCLLLEYPRGMSFPAHYFLFLWFLLVSMMSRSILRWVVRSIFSCSFVVVHVPAPYVVVGVTTASSMCDLVVDGKAWMSILLDVWRMRTKRIGFCVVSR